MNDAVGVHDINVHTVRDGTRHRVHRGIPNETPVLRTHADEVSLESGRAHHARVHHRGADDIDEAFDFSRPLGLRDDGIKHRFTARIQSKESAVGLSHENACRRKAHLSGRPNGERRHLTLVMPTAFARHRVKGRHARIRRTNDHEPGTDQGRYAHFARKAHAPKEFPRGVINLEISRSRSDRDEAAVGTDARRHVRTHVRLPKPASGREFKGIEFVAARSVNRIFSHCRRQKSRQALAHRGRPLFVGFDDFVNRLQFRRFMRVRRAAAREYQRRRSCCGESSNETEACHYALRLKKHYCAAGSDCSFRLM